jgi:hypothetical protein
MPLEKRFVDGHVFDADDPLSEFQLRDPIHKQKRIAMGQDFDNVFIKKR